MKQNIKKIKIKKKVSEARNQIENNLLEQINNVDENINKWSKLFKLQQLQNEIAQIGNKDLLRIILKPDLLKQFNPFFNKKSQDQILKDIKIWMKLCVLEDKLKRIEKFMQNEKHEQHLIQELQTIRKYDLDEQIEWLVYEVENNLQIRPVQYRIAEHFIKNPDCVVQLNMGEGKTRVILPMMILYWSKQKKQDQIIRLHFLSQLLGEAQNHLQNQLSGSVFNFKLFLLPFNRDVNLTPNQVDLIKLQLDHCSQSNSFLIVAPEHRLSLNLKWYELHYQSSNKNNQYVIQKLQSIYDLNYVEIFDESDELLCHKYQLIYSLGTPNQLLSGQSRWNIVQQVFNVIESNQKVRTLLDESNVSVQDQLAKSIEKFNKLRLIHSDELEKQLDNLNITILEALFENPSHYLQWMEVFKEKKKQIIQYVLMINDEENKNQLEELMQKDKVKDDILMLRGLLGYKQIYHFLKLRHRVDYGIKKVNCKKKLAVPFKSSDTPSERSEFGMPDTAIVLTILSYYYQGLNEIQIFQAFDQLLKLGLNAQISIYNEWFNLSSNNMKQDERSQLDSVNKIDLSNQKQKGQLIQYYSSNRKTIDFWLNYIVFPNDTIQYQYKVTQNSWNLAYNKNNYCFGFSGTDDKNILLPLSIKQKKVKDENLMSTNGKMWNLLLKNKQYINIDEEEGEGLSQWQKVINISLKRKSRALIDVGALFSGVSNKEVGEYYLKQIKENNIQEIKGVIYFDENWQVEDIFKRKWELHQNSPIKEDEGFVFFDQSRCRGADMKLKENAEGIITLGPKLCKDSLMQAAGRMRQLDKGQSIIIIGTSEITSQIRKVNQLTMNSVINSQQVLQWIMFNTIHYIQYSILDWSNQALYFSHAAGNTSFAKQDEMFKLYHLYQQNLQPVNMKNHHYSHLQSIQSLFNKNHTISNQKQLILHSINLYIDKYASDFTIISSNLDDQCEREIQQENEVEKEIEKQLPKQNPYLEIDWQYQDVFLWKSAIESKNKQIQYYIQHYLDKKIDNIPWQNYQIYCTQNFFISIQQKYNEDKFDNYLRFIDIFLYFPYDKSVLLLSEREAECILNLIWKKQLLNQKIENFQLFNLTYSYTQQNCQFLKFDINNIVQTNNLNDLDSNIIALLLLFNAETQFKNDSVREALKNILKDNQKSQQAALLFSQFRGLSFMLERSELQKVCILSNNL